MTKQERLDRVNSFLDEHFEQDNASEGYEKDMLQGDPKNRYYLLLEGEYYGCYANEGHFLSEEKLLEFIVDMCFDGNMGDHRTAWDSITVFDIDQNKTVKPGKITWQ